MNILINIVFLVVSFLAVENGCLAEPAPVADAATIEAPLAIGPHEQIQSVAQHEENAEQAYKIDVKYPQIASKNLSPAAQEFNKLVLQMVNQTTQEFKNYVKADAVHMQTLPEEIRHNSLSIDYDVDLVKPENKRLVSVRLTIEGMQAGRPHPYHQHQILNFDLSTGKVVTLGELFKPNSNYLSLISKYANNKLSKTLKDKWMISEGTKPDAKNYKMWNIENDSILITFDEYQVASYADGAQEVEIPFSALQKVIGPKALISPCVKNSDRCVV